MIVDAASQFETVLVGVEFEENLSLRYLAGALAAGGYPKVRIVAYNSVHQAQAVARQIAALSPRLVGISMAFQSRALEDLLLCKLLREYGYQGHLAAGGQFVTLHYVVADSRC